MIVAATVCALVALVVLLNIEAWRRRVSAELSLEAQRDARRVAAWDAVRALDEPRLRRAA